MKQTVDCPPATEELRLRRVPMPALVRPDAGILSYALAGLLVVLAGAAQYLAQHWLDAPSSFLTFTLAVLVSALWWGAGPAIAATIGSIVLSTALFNRDGFVFEEAIRVLLFVLVAGTTIAVARFADRSRGLARDSDRRAQFREREALELAEELDLLIDGAEGHAIYMLDATGHVTIWNRGAERLKGWTEAEAIGKHTSIFYPSDAIAAGKPQNDLAKAAAAGRIEEEDWRLRKDGTEFLASVSITALFENDGSLRGFAKVVSDITERRAVEEALRAREEQLRSILSTVPDGMVVIDECCTILSFSPAAEKLFGYCENEVKGCNVSMLMPSPDRERHDGYIHRYLETGEKRIIGTGRIVFGRRRDGTTFPMELSIGEAVAGTQRIFTGFIRDLTEREQTEQRLELLQSELIHVARVSAMGTMASTLAHELNQPITAIANYTEAIRDLLADPNPDDLPDIREALDDTAKEALRAGHIVRRLRDFVARGEVEKTVEKLPELISEAAVLGLLGAKEKGVDAHFDIDPYASPVVVDKVQIQQVLINLIRNAVEAMSDCEQKSLTISSRLDGSDYVRVIVADTGPGISPEVAQQLFTAFVSTKAEGMGLGLSICRTIVEANGGRIWVEPNSGGGTEFHFTIMRARLEESNER